jgi:hypothetical protein
MPTRAYEQEIKRFCQISARIGHHVSGDRRACEGDLLSPQIRRDRRPRGQVDRHRNFSRRSFRFGSLGAWSDDAKIARRSPRARPRRLRRVRQCSSGWPQSGSACDRGGAKLIEHFHPDYSDSRRVAKDVFEVMMEANGFRRFWVKRDWLRDFEVMPLRRAIGTAGASSQQPQSSV